MSRRSAIPLTRTLLPLALAPLAGLAVLLVSVAVRESLHPHARALIPGPTVLELAVLIAWRTAPFCYAPALLLALPLLVFAPSLRRPTYTAATLCGILIAWTSFVILQWTIDTNRDHAFLDALRGIVQVRALFFFSVVGGATGLLYAVLVRRRTTVPSAD